MRWTLVSLALSLVAAGAANAGSPPSGSPVRSDRILVRCYDAWVTAKLVSS